MARPVIERNQCKGLCHTEYGGIKKFTSPKTHPGVSMFMLGYWFCKKCGLFFHSTTSKIKREDNGVCRCCGYRLRTRPVNGLKNNSYWVDRRDARRI
jgi:hypothetical protein